MKKSPYTRAETWAIRPDNHNLGDGGSDAGHFSKSVRKWRTPSCFASMFQTRVMLFALIGPTRLERTKSAWS
jgi:hypothetical protein